MDFRSVGPLASTLAGRTLVFCLVLGLSLAAIRPAAALNDTPPADETPVASPSKAARKKSGVKTRRAATSEKPAAAASPAPEAAAKPEAGAPAASSGGSTEATVTPVTDGPSVSAPTASGGAGTDLPPIPGYAPLPFNPGEMPQIQLVPQGQVPMQPESSFLGDNLTPPGPLTLQPSQPPDLKALKYPVSRFTIRYGPVERKPHPGLPPASALATHPILLGQSQEKGGGLVGPGAGARDIPVQLAQFRVAEMFSGDALQAVYAAVVADLNQRGISGVFVLPDPAQINPSTGEDLRQGKTGLTLIVYASEVRQVRTIVKPVAKFPFKTASTQVNGAKYARITAGSPLQPPVARNEYGSLLLRRPLQDYVDRINRFPGRRVDLAVTASGEQGGVILDYIVHTETPAVFVFDQTSNTGTEASGKWRTRVGLELRQLSGMDDVLDASFDTSLTTATYSAFGSYQITPVFPDVFKLKLYGGYGRFHAQDVGFNLANFTGKSATAGLLGIYTPYYFKGYPIDLILGLEYKYVDIADQKLGDPEGSTNFLLPIAGVATEKNTEFYNVSGSAQLEVNLPDLIGTDSTQLQRMGRTRVDRGFLIARYSLGTNFFLERLLFPKDWKSFAEEPDPAKRGGYWHKVTEAHEVSFQVHGQYTFADRRLVPQFEDVLGGFATVRGYPEAYTSGDDSVVFNTEYRFHVSRLFKPEDLDRVEKPGASKAAAAARFSLRPPTILGRPDLDILLRAFYDVGYIKNNHLQSATEIDRTLMAIGVGAEAQVYRNLNLRLDVGFPLLAVEDKYTSRPVSVGSSRISFVGVISY